MEALFENRGAFRHVVKKALRRRKKAVLTASARAGLEKLRGTRAPTMGNHCYAVGGRSLAEKKKKRGA